MVGPQYDFFANPLGAVRLTFEKAVAASPDSDPAVFDRKDWGAVDLFREFLFDHDCLSQVPILDLASSNWIPPNSLVRFRGMVQDMLDNELYIGAFKDGLTWRTNKFSDVSVVPMDPASQKRLWERRLLYCVPVPGQNSWTLESSSPSQRYVPNNCTSQHGEKRLRDAYIDEMDFNVSDHAERELSSSFKKQKEDESCCQSSRSSEEIIVHNSQSKPSMVKHMEANSLSCLVKIYDTPEADLKLNDVIEFIGIYTFDPDAAIQKDEPDDLSYDLLEDVLVHISPSKVPRVHCLVHRKLTAQDFILTSHIAEPLPNLLRGIRESLVGHLTTVLGSDRLAAHCVLLHLLSRVRARVDMVSVGKLSLNLTGFTRESASIFGNQLTLLIKSMLPFSRTIPLSVEYLNTTELRPRKDNQTGRMVAGVLQLAQGTHLTVDETHLNAGTLNSTGLENVRLLKHLMEWQKVEYDFEYYKLEMPADVQVLILSEGKSNILPADLVIPFRPTVVTSVSASAEQLEAWRAYLASLRSLYPSIEPELQKILEDDLVAAKKEDGNLRGEDFSRWLTLAQLISLSFGESSLSLEHWQMAKELERLRKERQR